MRSEGQDSPLSVNSLGKDGCLQKVSVYQCIFQISPRNFGVGFINQWSIETWGNQKSKSQK